jgi:cell wall-associated NlpC family hydrolase
MGVHVPLGSLVRGDLVFWANSSEGIHHVAIYLGNGMIIAAPQTGKVVQVEPLYNQGEIIGGVRL